MFKYKLVNAKDDKLIGLYSYWHVCQENVDKFRYRGNTIRLYHYIKGQWVLAVTYGGKDATRPKET